MQTRRIAGVSLVPMIMVLAAIFLAAPSSIATAQTPGTSVPATALVPTATAVVNFNQLAQQEASNPGPAKQPQAVPRALPSGQDSSAATGGSSTAAGTQSPSPAPSASFEALGDNNTVIPAGISGAVGPNYVLTALNSQIRLQNRAGTVDGTVSTDGFWAAVLPAGSTGTFDMRAVYDPFNQRWILAGASDPYNANSSIDVAVSQTGDPTGAWYLFRYDVDPQNQLWADYPMLGFDKDWIVVSTNLFTLGSNAFAQGQVYALNEAKVYSGDGTGSTVFTGKAVPFSLQPAETYDNTLGTEFLVRHVSSANGTEAKSTLAGAPPSLPTLTIDAAMLTSNLGGSSVPSGNSLPQSGSGAALDVGDARIQQVVVRTVNGQTSIWFVQTIALPAGGAPTHSAVQWWQVDGSSGFASAILQQGRIEDPTATQTNGGQNYSYPSLGVNRNNDVLVGYSLFSSNEFPSAGYSFRAGTDAANTMRGSTLLKAGLGAYVKTLGGSINRWGDFSHTVVDPADNTGLWTIQAYADTPVGAGDGSGRWATWWGFVQPAGIAEQAVQATAGCYTLSTSVNPGSTGSIGVSPVPNCNNGTQYSSGTNVSLTAYANSGYGFSSWSGDANGSSNPVTITMDGDKNVTANFATSSSSSSAFGKSSPADGATGQATALTLYWNGSSGASSYIYCIDSTDNNFCDNSWNNVGASTSVYLSGLSDNTTYFWQVNALDGNGNVIARADGGTWWSFTTGVVSPGAFGKSSPANGATGEALNLTLSWGTSSGATDYQYCIDTTNNNNCDTSWIDVGTNTSAALSGLNNNTTYYWQVQAFGSNGNIAADGGAWWSFSTLTRTPPGAFGKSNPANGVASQPTSLTLSWGSSSGATGYQYCIDTTNNNHCDGGWKNAGNHTSVNVFGLSYSTTYYWQVQARNAGGTAGADGGTWWSFTTEAPVPVANDDFGSATPITTMPFSTVENTTNATTAGDDPTFVCTGTQGAASVWFSFTPATDGILKANTSGSTYETILAVWQGTRGSLSNVACNDNKGASHKSAVTASLTGGTTYYVEVAGNTGGGGLKLSVSLKGTVPAAVKLLSPSNSSQSTTPSQVLDWSDSPGATYYQLQIHKGSASGPVVISTQPTVSTYTTGALAPARYFWKVEACSTNGCSAWSATWSFVIKAPAKPARPKLLSPASGSKGAGQPTLDWSDSAGATYYQVQIRENSSSGPLVASLSPTSSMVTTSGLASGHWYYWRVQACNVNGCSIWTGWWRVMIN